MNTKMLSGSATEMDKADLVIISGEVVKVISWRYGDPKKLTIVVRSA